MENTIEETNSNNQMMEPAILISIEDAIKQAELEAKEIESKINEGKAISAAKKKKTESPKKVDQVDSVDQTKVEKTSTEKDPYAYLDRIDFTSEKFKIEVRNLPKYYGIAVSKEEIQC